MQLRTGFVLSALEYDLIWSELELGPKRYPLEVPSHGHTMAERAALRAEALPAMVDGGLINDGKVNPDLADLLRLLDDPTTSIDLVGYSQRPMRAVAVAGPENAGLLATLDESGLAVQPIRDTALVSTIIAVLPPLPAGEGQSMSVPLEAMRKAAVEPDPEDFADDPFGSEAELSPTDLLVRNGVSGSDAKALSDLADSRVGGGQFGVAVATRPGGRLRRAESMVTWFDTPRGRYLMFGEGAWVSLAPAGPDRIAWRIEESLRQLRAG